MSIDAIKAAEVVCRDAMLAAVLSPAADAVDAGYTAIQAAYEDFANVIDGACADGAIKDRAIELAEEARMVAKDILGERGAAAIRVDSGAYVAAVTVALKLARMRAVQAAV
jgi:hypothetical protein